VRDAGPSQRFWPSRLRWRLRGAWLWPTFIVLTFVDGLILHFLPPVRAGIDVIPGVILASFSNLLLVGIGAPLLVRRLVRRRGPEGPPREVLLDRTATTFLAIGAVSLVAAGLAARPAIVSETEDTEQNAELVRQAVIDEGDPEKLRNLETANTLRLDEGFFRTCIAADDRSRAFCYFVNTADEPPTLREDTSPVPNAEFLNGGRAP